MIPISEIYGPVIQGEGPLSGRPTIFLRVGGCDYRCSWCDTPYAVLAEHASSWAITTDAQIARVVSEMMESSGCDHITLSGGNPALYNFGEVIRTVKGGNANAEFAIETQGTRNQAWFSQLDQIILSPKPPSSGMYNTDDHAPIERIFEHHGHVKKIALKIVVFDEADFAFARSLHIRWPFIPMWIQAGTDIRLTGVGDIRSQILAGYDRISNWVLKDRDMSDVHVSAQMHTLVHGQKRGI